jgi:hypothetical protein
MELQSRRAVNEPDRYGFIAVLSTFFGADAVD